MNGLVECTAIARSNAAKVPRMNHACWTWNLSRTRQPSAEPQDPTAAPMSGTTNRYHNHPPAASLEMSMSRQRINAARAPAMNQICLRRLTSSDYLYAARRSGQRSALAAALPLGARALLIAPMASVRPGGDGQSQRSSHAEWSMEFRGTRVIEAWRR